MDLLIEGISQKEMGDRETLGSLGAYQGRKKYLLSRIIIRMAMTTSM